MRKHEPSHYDIQSLLARMFKHRVIDPDTGCWVWTGSRRRGYGMIQSVHRGNHRAMRVHRIIAWLYLGYNGEEDVEICHSCNVKACFNPAHLYIASHAKNMADAVRDKLLKNHRRGEGTWKARLTEEKVREIRALYSGGGRTLRSLAKQFGVDDCTIGDVVHGRTWKHVSEVLQ